MIAPAPPQHPESKRDRVLPWVVAALFVAPLAWLAVDRAATADTANHDVAWTIAAGQKLAAGGEVGVNVIDVNPPLVYWLAALVSEAAGTLGLDALWLWMVIAAIAAVAVSALVGATARRHGTRASTAAALTVLCATALLPATGFDIGQRDHLVAAALVALCGSSASWLHAPRQHRGWGTSVLAAIAVALKPHHLLSWLGASAGTLRKGRKLGLLVLLGGGALYIGAIAALAPRQWQVLTDTTALYGAYDATARPPWELLAAIAGWSLARHAGERTWLQRFARTAAWSAGGAALAYLAQAKGFSYHRAPLVALSAASLSAAVLDFGQRNPGPRAGRNLLMVACAVAALAGGWEFSRIQAARAQPHRQRAAEHLTALLRSAPVQEGRRPLVLVADSASPPTWPILHYAGAHTALPYSCMWPIPGHYDLRDAPTGARFPYRTRAAQPPSERRFNDTVMHALRSRPALVLFNIGPAKQGFGAVTFDFRRYFARTPGFADAMAPYKNVGRLERFEVWQLQRDVIHSPVTSFRER